MSQGLNRDKTHYITVGDTLTPLGATLKQGGSAVNLTGKTVTFKMIKVAEDQTTEVVVNYASATVVTAASGEVQYDFAAADVDEAGVFFGWFRVESGGEYDHFPADKRKLRIIISSAD